MAVTPDDLVTIGQMVGVGFLTKEIAKPSLKRVGEAIEQVLFGNRADEKMALLKGAVEMLAEVGDKPQAVPGRILFEVLEHGAWEEEPELQRKWAALLANAASSGPGNKVLPAYAEILRQLTPIHVRIIDWMYDRKIIDNSGIPTIWPTADRNDIELLFELSPADYALFITDLDRLQILQGRRIFNLPVGFSTEDTIGSAIDQLNSPIKYDIVHLTALGIRFIEACRPPKPSA